MATEMRIVNGYDTILTGKHQKNRFVRTEGRCSGGVKNEGNNKQYRRPG